MIRLQGGVPRAKTVNMVSKRDRRSFSHGRRLLPERHDVPRCLSYIVEGKRIRFPGNPEGVQFAFPIDDVIETEEAIVVCLKVPQGSGCAGSVYAIARDGNVIWRVQPQMIEGQNGPYLQCSHEDLCTALRELQRGDRVLFRPESV